MRLSSRERVVTNTFEWYYVQDGDCLYFNFGENVINAFFFYLSVNVFSKKVLIGDTIFYVS